MSSDVVLSSALRSNLLSLQNTQSLIDQTQLRLATGLKVNSALDNPANFFSAQSLKNRAGDLTRLLDGISQSIRTIEEADNGVRALTSLIEQADSVVGQAREALSGAGSTNASVTGNVNLEGETDLVTNITGIDNSDQITLTTTDADGNAVTLSSATVTISTNDSIDQLLTAINDLTNTSDSSQAFQASLTDDGFLKIETLQGGKLQVDFSTGGLDLAEGLGFDQFTLSERDGSVTGGAAANRFSITASNTTDIESVVLFETESSQQVIAERSTLLTSLVDDGGTTLGFAGDSGDAVTIAIDGGTEVDLGDIASLTIQGFVDAINDNNSLNTKIRASFSETTGKISIEQLDTTINTVTIGAQDDGTGTTAGAAIGFGFGVETIAATNATNAANEETENITFGNASATLVNLETDYNTLLEQIDDIVNDASYRGVNLLNNDNLETTFNEDESSSLTTEGANFTSGGLDISTANFKTLTTVSSAENEISDALAEVRNFGTTLANDLAIIQIRREFTQETINTLQSGADDLTVADQNEEGANLLALQTRQTLGVTSLSLASQSQQAVLRLF